MSHNVVSRSDWMSICTTRIETETLDGKKGTGTGFFFVMNVEDNNESLVLVTNKHVLHGAKSFSIFLTKQDENNKPINIPPEKITATDFDGFLVDHPDPKIDLCVYLLDTTLNYLKSRGEYFYYGKMGFEMIPTDDELKDIAAIEDIVMVGYPNGIWDEINNQPLIRKGITSSAPSINWNNRPVFLIDAACFPGSSGSPIFLYNPLGYQSKDGPFKLGESRFKFLGVLFAGPQHTAKGKVIEVPIATTETISLSKIPNNLGVVINSKIMKDFIPLVANREKLITTELKKISLNNKNQ